MDEHFGTIIVGGGQSGLAMGYELQRKGLPFVILDGAERTGDSWRNRWDSLRLFTPARFSALPGLRFTGHNKLAPTKDEMADYLVTYAEKFELPIRHGVKVDGLTREDGRFVVTAGADRYTADQVVVATGAFHTPWTPAFAAELDPRIVQIHSRDYRNPTQLRPGGVLLVGAGNSGSDIAIDVASTHPTWLAGRHPGHVPFRIEGRVTHHLVHVVRFVGHHVLTWRSPIGRKVLPKFMQGGNPVVRIKPKDIVAAGIEYVPRVAGVRDGLPMLDDERVLNVTNVIWCTGFRTSFSWIDLPVFAPDGAPLHQRGVVEAAPGLYFVGLDFQFAVTSETITGVGRDAAYVARHMKRHPVATGAGGSLVGANAGDGDDGQPRTGT